MTTPSWFLSAYCGWTVKSKGKLTWNCTNSGSTRSKDTLKNNLFFLTSAQTPTARKSNLKPDNRNTTGNRRQLECNVRKASEVLSTLLDDLSKHIIDCYLVITVVNDLVGHKHEQLCPMDIKDDGQRKQKNQYQSIDDTELILGMKWRYVYHELKDGMWWERITFATLELPQVLDQ